MPLNLQQDRVLAQRPRLQEACLKLQGIAQELGEEAKLPTMVELRNQLGISVQTLSDAVRELEKRSILNSVRGVGIYVTPQRDRLLTGNIGFVTPHYMPPAQDISYWGEILAGMREAARDRGCHLLLIDDGEAFTRWEKIDGAVLCQLHDPRNPLPQASLLPRGFPCVAILNEIPATPLVTADDFEGQYQLTQHLIHLGHRRIAYLMAANAEISQLEQRKRGYLQALREAGIKSNPRWIRDLHSNGEWENLSNWYVEAGERFTNQWLQEDWQEVGCTALMVQNDEAAQGAIAAFQATGLEVPRHVSVVGFDGWKSFVPQLTTVRVPLFEIGHTAMRLLLDWLENPLLAPQSTYLPVSFIEGQTTAQMPRSN